MEEKAATHVSTTNGGNCANFNERKVLPICSLCKMVPEKGIRSGFFMKGIFICSCCENELITCKPESSGEYKLAIAKLRKALFKEKPWR
jgi:hypothetical protein